MIMDGETGLMSEEHVFDLLAAYAMGILEEDESLLVHEHLDSCAICQRELATYNETVAQMAIISTQMVPAHDLKEKVLHKAQQAAKDLHTRVPEKNIEKTSFKDRLSKLSLHPAAIAMAALALFAIIFLVINMINLRQQLNSVQKMVANGYMQVVRLEGTDLAPQAGGYVMVFEDEKYGSLAVTHAPQLEEDHQYQIWLIRDGIRTSGGVFSVNADGYGNLMVSAEQPLDTFQYFGITIEPAGGSPQPTGDKILGGDL